MGVAPGAGKASGALPTTEAASYDYVIVGGGSAGCVVASRLAAASPDATVLLIEAGPNGRGVAQIVDPPSWTKLSGTALDWGYAYMPADAGGRPRRSRSRGGRFSAAAARPTRCSGTGATRPTTTPGRRPARPAGTTRRCCPTSAQRGLGGRRIRRRGAGGPMRVTRPPEPHPIAAAMVDGAAELGLPRLDDANAGENCGAALANLNIAEGRRFSAVDGYLPAWAPPPAPGQVPVGAWTQPPDPPANLTVLTGSTALRLGFSGSPRRRRRHPLQRGVPHRARLAAPDPRADRGRARARRLRHARAARSGPASATRPTSRRLGLPVQAALPGVGRNLQDHPLVMGVNFRARSRLGLTRDNGGGAIMNWRSSRARPARPARVRRPGTARLPGRRRPVRARTVTPTCSRSRRGCSARAASDG